jgi:hypothetical protein
VSFTEIDRPQRNKRSIKDRLDWDEELEEALLHTLVTGKAIDLTLTHFHSSPAKGRLWKQGYSVRHRVIGPDQVGAWLEPATKRKPKGETTNG